MRAFARRPSSEEIAKIEQVNAAASRPSIPVPTVLAPAQERQSATIPPAVGQIIEVPIQELKANPLNARRVISPAGLDELAEGLKARGQDIAATAYFDEETKSICLIDGHRRLEAQRLAGNPTLRVEIRPRPENDQELYLASRAANTDRESQTPIDDALAWKLLLERKIFASQVELARRLNIDTTLLSRTLGLGELPKTLITMLSERPSLMTLRMLDAIKRFYDVAGEEQSEALILEIANHDLSSRDVDNRRKAFEKGPVSRARSAIQTAKYDKGNTTVKRFVGKGRVILEITNVVTEEDVDLLTEELTKTVAKFLTKSE